MDRHAVEGIREDVANIPSVRELVLLAAWSTLGAWKEVPQDARSDRQSPTKNWAAIFEPVVLPARS